VWSLTASRKRKRHEVVVGVDGETLNIYNVCLTGQIAHLVACPNQ
jgi:hypothetical protein